MTQPDDSAPMDGTSPDEVAPDPSLDGALVAPSIVDWGRTARRMRSVLAVLAILVVVTWTAAGLLGDGGFRPRLLTELFGLAILAAILAEIAVVGGAALRGMLRAGDRGERLAGSDVSLLPPQLGRRRR